MHLTADLTTTSLAAGWANGQSPESCDFTQADPTTLRLLGPPT